MKKFSVAVIGIFCILTLGVLSACSFKKVEVNFTESEVVLSVGETVDLSSCMELTGVKAQDVEFKFSNSALVSLTDQSVTALSSGRTYVYATYNGNSLDSMKLVIKQTFSCPTNITLSDDGLLSWDVVSGYFDTDTTLTTASSYIVSGTLTTYSENGKATETEFSESTSTNSLQLSTSGVYSISVTAVGSGYFDSSKTDLSDVKTFYFGYMAELSSSDFSWSDGVLSWSEVAGAEYQVVIDETKLAVQTDAYVDLNSYFESSATLAGEHSVSVIVIDSSDEKISKQSETLTITKLSTPTVATVDGQISITTTSDAQKYLVVAKSVTQGTEDFSTYLENEIATDANAKSNANSVSSQEESAQEVTYAVGTITSAIENLPSGIYTIYVSACNETGLYFQSEEFCVGLVYKLPELTISGLGTSEIDGENLKLSASSDAVLVSTTLKISGFEDAVEISGLEAGQNSANIEVQLPTSGTFELSFTQVAAAQDFTYQGESVFVLASDPSEEISAVRLEAFSSEIEHECGEVLLEGSTNSTLTFDAVSGATSYALQIFDGSNFVSVDEEIGQGLYSVKIENSGVTITLSDAVENLFAAYAENLTEYFSLFEISSDDESVNESTQAYILRVVACSENELLCVKSSQTKILKILSTPQSANSGNSSNKTYSWGQVDGAQKYLLEIYTLEKAQFDAVYPNGVEEDADLSNLDLTNLEPTSQTVQTNEYEFARGYYYARIYALTGDENQYISSQTPLEEVFFVSDDLAAADFSFGYDSSSVGTNGSSGYFLNITVDENVSAYTVEVTDSENKTLSTKEISASGTLVQYYLTQTFESGTYYIKVTATASDTTLFVTSEKSLAITRVEEISSSSEYLSVSSSYSQTQTVSVTASEGVSAIKITNIQTEKYKSSDKGSVSFDISLLSPVSLKFTLSGSDFNVLTNLYTAQTNQTVNVVYLENESTITFTRLDNPTNLYYYNGALLFESSGATHSSAAAYVLDVVGESETISVVFFSNNTAPVEVWIGGDLIYTAQYSAGTYLSSTGSTADGYSISIDLASVLSLFELEENAAILQAYAQMTSVQFCVYAYRLAALDEANFSLSSVYATAKDDQTASGVTIQKLSSTTLSYNSSTLTLSWEEVSTREHSTNTQYVLYKDGEVLYQSGTDDELDESIDSASTSSVTFSQVTTGTFQVVVTNPYYLNSATSNSAVISQLSAITSLSLTSSQNLKLTVSAQDSAYVTDILVNETSQKGEAEQIELEDDYSFTFEIPSGETSLSVTLVGTSFASSDTTYYYLSSQESVWILADLSSLVQDASAVTVENGTISWTALADFANSSAVKYLLVFVDENGNSSTFETAKTSVSWSSNSTLRNALNGISAGNVYLAVYANITAHSIAVGGTIYSASAISIYQNGDFSSKYNYALIKDLSSVEINSKEITYSVIFKKLTAPSVSEVTFATEVEGSYVNDPDVTITFTGNYGETGNFTVYLAGIESPIYSRSLTGTQIGTSGIYTYSFTISADKFSNLASGQSVEMSIYATDSNSFPSSAGTATFTRASTITSIECEASEIAGYEQNLIVSLSGSSSMYLGGVVLNLTITSNGGTVTTLQEPTGAGQYDLSSIVSTYLSEGGTIEVVAFVNAYSNSENSIFVLSSLNSTTFTFNVAPSVIVSGDDSQITLTNYGFLIEDASSAATIVVVANGETFTLSYDESAGGFKFSVPETWTDSEYTNIQITVYESGYIVSETVTTSYTLTRAGQVSDLAISRKDATATNAKGEQILSWSAATNAASYIVNVYIVTEDEEGQTTKTLLYSLPVSGTSVEFSTLFGDSAYTLLSNNGVDLTADNTLCLEVISVGASGYNNGFATTLENVSLKGNSLTNVTSFGIDKYGRITFARGSGNTYLYRFQYTTSGNDSVTTEWFVMDSDVLDSSSITADMSAIYVQVKVMGDGETIPAQVDSVAFSTQGYSRVYFKLSDFDSIAPGDEQEEETQTEGGSEADGTSSTDVSGMLKFTMSTSTFNNLYVGTSESAIFDGEVVSFNPTYYGLGDENTTYVYTYSISLILDALTQKNYLEEDAESADLYFWVYNETNDPEWSWVVSNYYKYSISLSASLSYTGVLTKGVYNSSSSGEDVSYLGSYALFSKVDNTVGIYVKVSQVLEEGSQEVGTYLVSASQLINYANLTDGKYDFANYHVINLLDVFDQYAAFTTLVGTLEIDFARLCFDGTVYSISTWLSEGTDSSAIKITRLDGATSLKLSDGNFAWQGVGDQWTMFYVTAYDSSNSLSYTTLACASTVFDTSNFSGQNEFHLSVRSTNSTDATILSSEEIFYTDGDGNKQSVTKNSFASKLVLSGGKLYITWQYADFSDTIENDSDNLTTATFSSPFTMTFAQLLSGSLTVRLKFTKINADGSNGTIKTFDISAGDLLAPKTSGDLTNLVAKLDGIASGTGTTANFAAQVSAYFSSLSGGVATSEVIFDDYFEKLQTGNYSLSYCLVGSSTTINSGWYTFENGTTEDGSIYVNTQPNVSVSSSTSGTLNTYTVKFAQSKIYIADGTTETATSYVMRLKPTSTSSESETLTFSIVVDGETATMTILGQNSADSVTVSVSGSYLSFAINYNSGDSLVGKYGAYINRSEQYEMQIYAVGNSASLSSKSEYFELNFLDFTSLSVENGEFVWTTTQSRSVAITSKKSGSGSDSIEYSDKSTSGSFSLEDKAEGNWTVSFVLQGEIANSYQIYVDSDTYIFSNVYKLKTPTVNANLGLININGSSNNSALANSYSSTSLYMYKISNDISTTNSNYEDSSYLIVSDTRTTHTSAYGYEAGVTGMTQSSDDLTYKYKTSEVLASEFYVSMIGSTAEISYSDVSYGTTTYYQKYGYVGKSTTNVIAISSGTSTTVASMLDGVEEVSVSDSVVTWSEVEGRGYSGSLTRYATDADVIYRVVVERYITTVTTSGTSYTYLDESTFYTQNNYLDLSVMEKSDNDYVEGKVVYLSLVVQAFTGTVQTDEPSTGTYVQLVEGGYVKGDALYSSKSVYSTELESWVETSLDEDIYVLMGNGTTLDSVTRIETINSSTLKVNEEGNLTWTWTYTNFDSSNFELDENNLLTYYQFYVRDEDGNLISGDYEVVSKVTSDDGITFTIEFAEDDGQISSGTQTLYVYVVAGKSNTLKQVSSYGTALSVTKLAKITTENYEIETTITTETLSMEDYFASVDEDSQIYVYATITLEGEQQGQTFTFTKDNFKLFVLSEELEEGETLDAEGNENYILDTDGNCAYFVITSSATISFVVSGYNSKQYFLASDTSDEFGLIRSSWDETSAISWNSTSDEFSWEYNYKAFSGQIEATAIDAVYTLNSDGENIYSNTALTGLAGVSLSGEVDLVEYSTYAAVLVEGVETYYISKTSYTTSYVAQTQENEDGEAEEVTKTLSASSQFVILDQGSETSIVKLTTGGLYQVQNSYIVDPQYIVTLTYQNGETRTYTTSETYIQPTVMGTITSMVVRIKINDVNLISESLQYSGGEVSVDLFNAGQGTEDDPYEIATATQFKNIAYRQSKDENLASYQNSDDETVAEESMYYFEITQDIDLGSFAGILFSGSFTGVIEGNEKTITYASTSTATLTNSITIATNSTIAYLDADKSALQYTSGSSLFETLSSSAEISNLKISAHFGKVTESGNDTTSTVAIYTHSLISPLAITNGGKVSGVSLVGFTNRFYGAPSGTTSPLMAYSGLVSINSATGEISSCSIECNMAFPSLTTQTQFVSVAGVVYTNYGRVTNCSTQSGITISVEMASILGTVQVAGIECTNASGSTITSCTNNATISVSGTTDSSAACYAAGVFVYAKGTYDASNTSSTTPSVVNMGSSTIGTVYCGE